MSYKNPIRLLTSDQIKRLNPASLKSLKKEILLEFQFTEEPVIERNGMMLDKNLVLELWKDLEDDLTLHLQIHENKYLSQFLETGSLSFFENSESQQKVLEDEINRNKTNEFVAEKLNEVTSDLLVQIDETTFQSLSVILAYTSQLPTELQDLSYAKAYTSLKSKVNDLPISFPSPYTNTRALAFHKDIHQLVNIDFFNCFAFLPLSFIDIAERYAIWCHNHVVEKALERENHLTNYKRGDLKTLAKAFDIGEEVTTFTDFIKNGKLLRRILGIRKNKLITKINTVSSKGEQGHFSVDNKPLKTNNVPDFLIQFLDGISLFFISSYYTFIRHFSIIFPVLLIIALFSIAGLKHWEYLQRKEESRKNKRPSIPSFQTKKEFKSTVAEYFWAKKGNRNLILNESENSGNYVKRKYAEQFLAGDGHFECNPVITRALASDSLLELDFEVSIIPTIQKNFSYFIPVTSLAKYKNQKIDYILQFKDPEDPDQVFRHRLRNTFHEDGRHRKIVYVKEKEREEKPTKKRTINLRYKVKSMSGKITRLLVDEMEVVRTTPFQISYDPILQHSAMQKIAPDGSKNDTRFAKFRGYNISSDLNQNYKNCILSYLELINGKHMEIGNTYPYYREQILRYSISPSDLRTDEFTSSQVWRTNGVVSYLSHSIEDGISIIAVDGEGFKIRFFATEGKGVIRMQMTMSLANGKAVDLIEVILDK